MDHQHPEKETPRYTGEKCYMDPCMLQLYRGASFSASSGADGPNYVLPNEMNATEKRTTEIMRWHLLRLLK